MQLTPVRPLLCAAALSRTVASPPNPAIDADWVLTLKVGPVPSEINYGDYRTVAGIQMPFTWTATQTYMQMTITLRGVSVNVPVDASRFARPREFRAANR